jgi:hypothetical protein
MEWSDQRGVSDSGQVPPGHVETVTVSGSDDDPRSPSFGGRRKIARTSVGDNRYRLAV